MNPIILERLRTVPQHSSVIPHSIPVISFGDYENVKVATLGLNPSKHEFYEKNLLSSFRFETLKSIGVESQAEMNESQALVAWNSCKNYFKKQPYTSWFDYLEKHILNTVGVSYYDGTSAHLDLVQSATDPVWGSIDKTGLASLLELDVRFLKKQIEESKIETLLINGSTASNTFLKHVPECSAIKCETLLGKPNCIMLKAIWQMPTKDVTVFSWSNNLQSTRGLTNLMRNKIGDWINLHLS